MDWLHSSLFSFSVKPLIVGFKKFISSFCLARVQCGHKYGVDISQKLDESSQHNVIESTPGNLLHRKQHHVHLLFLQALG